MDIDHDMPMIWDGLGQVSWPFTASLPGVCAVRNRALDALGEPVKLRELSWKDITGWKTIGKP